MPKPKHAFTIEQVHDIFVCLGNILNDAHRVTKNPKSSQTELQEALGYSKGIKVALAVLDRAAEEVRMRRQKPTDANIAQCIVLTPDSVFGTRMNSRSIGRTNIVRHLKDDQETLNENLNKNEKIA